jgi:putative ABC transport system permease protein
VPGLVSLAAVEVPEDADVPRVAAALARRVDAEVHTQLTARQVARRLLGVMDVAQWALSGVALVVAYLSVLTTMTMAGHERRAELGTLRALGARPGQVARLLAFDAVLLSALGGTLGVLGGVGLAAAVSAVTQTRLGVRALIVTPEVGLTALGVGVLVGVLAALPVAWRVGRESVSDALRSV